MRRSTPRPRHSPGGWRTARPARTIAALADGEDGREGVAAFLEKRSPRFGAR